MVETAAKKTDEVEDEWGEDVAPLLPSYPFEKRNPFTGLIEAMKVVPDVIGLNGEPRDVALFTVRSEVEIGGDEHFVIWGSGMLSRVLPDLVGKRVRIEDKGLRAQDDKTQLRVFDVRVAK